MHGETETARRAPTAEELKERLELRRAAGLSEDSATSASKPELAFQTFSSECRSCSTTFEWQAVLVAGKPVPDHRDRCDACITLAEKHIEQEQARFEDAQRQLEREARAGQTLELLHAVTGNAAEHRGMTFIAFDESECGALPVEVALDFLEETKRAGPYDPVRGIYLWGPTGPGKTHLIVSVVQGLLADPTYDPGRVLFDRADELILRIQDTYNTRESTFAVLERRWEADLWILDDLGTERPSDDAARHLNLIFSRRALRPTLVTSNHDPRSLQRKYTELSRLVSRFGPKYFRVVEVQGRDRRFDR